MVDADLKLRCLGSGPQNVCGEVAELENKVVARMPTHPNGEGGGDHQLILL